MEGVCPRRGSFVTSPNREEQLTEWGQFGELMKRVKDGCQPQNFEKFKVEVSETAAKHKLARAANPSSRVSYMEWATARIAVFVNGGTVECDLSDEDDDDSDEAEEQLQEWIVQMAQQEVKQKQKQKTPSPNKQAKKNTEKTALGGKKL